MGELPNLMDKNSLNGCPGDVILNLKQIFDALHLY